MKKPLVFLFLVFYSSFFTSCFAQDDIIINHQTEIDDDIEGDLHLFTGTRLDLQSFTGNNCLKYLNDTIGRSRVKFKSVTVISYTSQDSLLSHKKFSSKCLVHYNNRGDITSFILYDTAGMKDSGIAIYDSEFHFLEQATYERNDRNKKMVLAGILAATIDSKGHYIKLESWHNNYVNENDFNKYGRDSTFTIVYLSYNEMGNVIKYVGIENKQDTSMFFQTYDDENRVVAGKSYYNLAWESYYYKFDYRGFEIQNGRISGRDTTNEYTNYDDSARETSYYKYLNGKLSERRTAVYGFGMGSITNKEELKQPDEDNEGSSSSCITDTKTIDTMDHFGNLICETITTTGMQQPTIRIERHKYEYNRFGKPITDSQTVEERSQYHSAGTLSLCFHKYDDRGNMLEEIKRGGEGVESDTRSEYSYSEQNKLLSANDYGSCLDIPYHSLRIGYSSDGTLNLLDLTKGGYHYISTFGKDTRKLENIREDYSGIEQIIYKYEDW